MKITLKEVDAWKELQELLRALHREYPQETFDQRLERVRTILLSPNWGKHAELWRKIVAEDEELS